MKIRTPFDGDDLNIVVGIISISILVLWIALVLGAAIRIFLFASGIV